MFKKDLSSELVWYDLEKALIHHLQPKYLNEIDKNFIKSFCYKDIKQTIWKIAIWEENNIKYDYQKSEIKENASYLTDNYGRVISINANPNRKIQTPKQTLKRKKGICSDFAILTSAILLKCHHQPIYIFNTNNHAFASVKINKNFYAIDQHPPINELSGHLYSLKKQCGAISQLQCYKIWMNNNKIYLKGYNRSKAESYKNRGFLFNLNWSGKRRTVESETEHKDIAEVIMKILSKYLYIISDKNLKTNGKMFHLPPSYKEGVVLTLTKEDVKIDYIFKKQYGLWISYEIIKNFSNELKNYNRFWITVIESNKNEKRENKLIIKIYLAKK
jgi:hypothetical protein